MLGTTYGLTGEILQSTLKVFRLKLLHWYSANGREFPWRNKSATTYHRVVTEILLQRTRAETVSGFFPGFRKKYPSWKALALANTRELKSFLAPIGLATQRAPRLLTLAKEISGRAGRFPTEREEIDQLPGVGQYIGNAIEMFCLDRPRPLLDVNMARILERYFRPRDLADIRYDPFLQETSQRLVECKRPREVNWAVLDLGATVCTARKPRCNECPLKRTCNKGFKPV